eukprot:Skav213787  [mRNA]  locus=scaffold1122:63017:63934:- [translate_table: standard]
MAPKRGLLACEPCAAGFYSGEFSSICIPCPPGSVSDRASPTCTLCGAGRFATSSSTCEPCPAGFFALEASRSCLSCPSGSVSDPASSSCRQCSYLNYPDESRQRCEVDHSIEILLIVLAAVPATCFCLSCLTGFHGRIAIADVSTQGQKLVMTANLSHFLQKHSPRVTFKGTENPSLDNGPWKVQKLNAFQLTLHGSQLNEVDASMGYLIFQCPSAFIHTGLLRCPLILWCLLFGAASGAAMTRLTQSSILVAIALGICAGTLAFAWRCRWDVNETCGKIKIEIWKDQVGLQMLNGAYSPSKFFS